MDLPTGPRLTPRTGQRGATDPSDGGSSNAGADTGRGNGRAVLLARGICRHLASLGYSTLTEFRVGKGRRVDVIGLNRDQRFVIVEIKTSVADFRSDGKWPDYLPWCDTYYFAVPGDFPQDILPDDQGILVADAWEAAVIREASELPMNGTRRRTQVLKFALAAGQRLQQHLDPAPSQRWGGR